MNFVLQILTPLCPDNTWDMDIYIGEGKYYIYIEIDENKNKSE